MASEGDNLLVRLHRWAHRQDENFITEAFAHLLRHLLEHEPAAGLDLLRYLTDGRMDLCLADAQSIEVITQVTTTVGRPDIEILSTNHVVYVEAKAESGLGWRQLARYREALSRHRAANSTLVLLTRHLPEIGPDQGQPDTMHRWYEIAHHLAEKVPHYPWAHSLSVFLVRQFLDFLRARGMTMEQVTWELKRGVQSVWSLMDMIAEAAKGIDPTAKRSVGAEWAGYYVRSGNGWVGIVWDDPAQVLLHSTGVAVDAAKVSAIGYGELVENRGRDNPTGYRWQDYLNLESEEVHFFAHSRASQMKVIEEFVRKGIAAVAKLQGQ